LEKVMPRPKCPRFIGDLPDVTFYKPRGVPLTQLETVGLTFDEFEAIRLADLDGLYQEQAAEKMQISRATFGRVLESAHKKIAGALIGGKAIKIEGGVVKMINHRVFTCSACNHTWEEPFGTGRPSVCPKCGSDLFSRLNPGHGGGRRHRAGCHRVRQNRINSRKDEK
jgi:predicted DNA-binding protein (UPF0251 family)